MNRWQTETISVAVVIEAFDEQVNDFESQPGRRC